MIQESVAAGSSCPPRSAAQRPAGVFVDHDDGFPRTLVARLASFQQATGIGLRLTMDPADPDEFGQSGQSACAALNSVGVPCRICRETHGQLRSAARCGGRLARVTCHLGLTNFALAISLADDRCCYVEGGRILATPPKSLSRGSLAPHLRALGLDRQGVAAVQASLVRCKSVDPQHLNASLDLLDCLCLQLERDLAQPSTAPETGHPAIVKARKFIDRRLNERLAVSRMARHVHLSEDHFSRLFKRETGETFTAYLQRLRIHRACRQLRETAQPITEIALACGFDSIPHFNRLFRRLIGLPPRRFRHERGQSPHIHNFSSGDGPIAAHGKNLFTSHRAPSVPPR